MYHFNYRVRKKGWLSKVRGSKESVSIRLGAFPEVLLARANRRILRSFSNGIEASRQDSEAIPENQMSPIPV